MKKIILLLLLTACAPIDHSPQVDIHTETARITGPLDSVATVNNLYDVDRLNEEIASMYGGVVKSLDIRLLQGWDFVNTCSERATACYFGGVIILEAPAHNVMELEIAHEIAHHYGANEVQAEYISCRLVDDLRCEPKLP